LERILAEALTNYLRQAGNYREIQKLTSDLGVGTFRKWSDFTTLLIDNADGPLDQALRRILSTFVRYTRKAVLLYDITPEDRAAFLGVRLPQSRLSPS